MTPILYIGSLNYRARSGAWPKSWSRSGSGFKSWSRYWSISRSGAWAWAWSMSWSRSGYWASKV